MGRRGCGCEAAYAFEASSAAGWNASLPSFSPEALSAASSENSLALDGSPSAVASAALLDSLVAASAASASVKKASSPRWAHSDLESASTNCTIATGAYLAAFSSACECCVMATPPRLVLTTAWPSPHSAVR